MLAASLASAGSQVTVLSRSAPEELDGVEHIAVDLADAASLDAAADALVSERPPFRSLVFLQRVRAPDDAWADELTVSVEATKVLIESLTADRPAGLPGAIVLVGSLAADLVAPGEPLGYHVAKASLNAMVRYYAVALGPKGIRVNGVTPGIVLRAEATDFFRENPAEYERRVRNTPLGRMAHAQEIADVIGYLCGERASFVTGQVVVADGGLSLIFQGSLG